MKSRHQAEQVIFFLAFLPLFHHTSTDKNTIYFSFQLGGLPEYARHFRWRKFWKKNFRKRYGNDMKRLKKMHKMNKFGRKWERMLKRKYGRIAGREEAKVNAMAADMS